MAFRFSGVKVDCCLATSASGGMFSLFQPALGLGAPVAARTVAGPATSGATGQEEIPLACEGVPDEA
ncbi:hypothetical protein [Robbsia andropogonis]|uniref:hypothetical protein n=1 Tax=Robbsia andropogonis TaxID=28092 RepID=UPI00209E7550|nr:hypothetical protein [Robbsia andropogonis]